MLSIVCLHTGISAATYTVYSEALKSLKGVTSEGQLYKSTDDNQIIVINKVNGDRDLDFRLSHNEPSTDDWTDSTWQYVDIDSNYPKVLQIYGGLFSGNEYIALFVGNKKLVMRTCGIYIGVTGLYGSWWTSESEYHQYNG